MWTLEGCHFQPQMEVERAEGAEPEHVGDEWAERVQKGQGSGSSWVWEEAQSDPGVGETEGLGPGFECVTMSQARVGLGCWTGWAQAETAGAQRLGRAG